MKRLSRPWEVSRRACVRGIGSAIGLPMLEAMLPGIKRAGAAGASPKRLVFFVFTGGIPDNDFQPYALASGSFWPKTPGPRYETTRILESFERYGLKQDIVVVRNLSNFMGEVQPDAGHGKHANAFLTGVEPKDPEGGGGSASISVDQVAASFLKQYTPALPSLYLTNPFGPFFLPRTMSWTSATTKAPITAQPLAAFNKIFGDQALDATALKKRIAYKLSVFSHAKADIDRVRSKVGKADRQSLENYFDSISSLEAQVSASGKLDACKTPATTPMDSPLVTDPTADPNHEERHYNVDMPSHFKKMADLITAAFRCDRTRVAVVHLYTHEFRFWWLGPPYDQFPCWHDDIQHVGGDNVPLKVETYVRGAASEVEQFAYLVKMLKDTPEGDGTNATLLDNSLLVCASEAACGSHSINSVPIILAGGAGGLIGRGQGRYVALPREQPVANLWVTMLNAIGVKDSQGRDFTAFGSTSTGALSLG